MPKWCCATATEKLQGLGCLLHCGPVVLPRRMWCEGGAFAATWPPMGTLALACGPGCCAGGSLTLGSEKRLFLIKALLVEAVLHQPYSLVVLPLVLQELSDLGPIHGAIAHEPLHHALAGLGLLLLCWGCATWTTQEPTNSAAWPRDTPRFTLLWLAALMVCGLLCLLRNGRPSGYPFPRQRQTNHLTWCWATWGW